MIEEAVRAAMANADRTIAAADTIYAGNDAHYFSVAASALRSLLIAVESAGRTAPRRILDFGCGHGRVMRALRAAFPDAELLGCDVDADAVAYCATAFGARPVKGSTDLARLEPVFDIDLIWCGSVLTHLDAPQWRTLLDYFATALVPGGVAVVTTHGRRAAWRLEQVMDYGLDPKARAAVLGQYRASGFGYGDYQGYGGYGISLSAPPWTVAKVLATQGLRLIGYVEAGWDWHQDVVSIAKDADRLLERI